MKKEAELLDSAALAFTRAFYLALVVGDTVQNAFNIGQQVLFGDKRVNGLVHESN